MQKIILLIFGLYLATMAVQAQNIGIGTNTPTYPLTVISKSNRGIAQKAGPVEMGFFTDSAAGSAYLQTWSNHDLKFAVSNGTAAMVINTQRNVGIGTDNPAARLHVFGNAVIENNIGLGTSSPAARLHVASGNALLMGNVGIGTTSPTANLDLNGTLRLRGSFPKKGSVLTSDDTNGNASWADPVAFRVSGLAGGSNLTVPEVTWTKVTFSTTAAYNLGLSYQPFLYQFLAPENGIYHFDLILNYDGARSAYQHKVRLVLVRNGITSTLTERYYGLSVSVSGDLIHLPMSQDLSADAELQAGDVVYVETWVDGVSNQALNNLSSGIILSSNTFFSGHLVARK